MSSRNPSDESTEIGSPSSNNQEKQVTATEINGRDEILSVAFLVDGKHIVSGGREGKIRRWRVQDGKEVGTPMNVKSTVGNIAVSRDGKWVVSGTWSGLVTVWHAESHENLTEFRACTDCVRAVDVSPDATRIATGLDDCTACVWSLLTGKRLLGPLKHVKNVVGVKFSPDGHLIATATWFHSSIRLYDSQNGSLLVDFPIRVNSLRNQSLAWASDSKQLFVLSVDGNINCLDVSTRTTFSQWHIHNNNDPTCIALASNGRFIAASAESSVSFWDTLSHNQIGTVVEHAADIESMAVSANCDIVIGGDKKVTLRSLSDILPSPYRNGGIRHAMAENVELDVTIGSPCVQDDDPDKKIANLERIIQELRHELTTANQDKNSLNETIGSLRAQGKTANSKIAQLEKTGEQLRTELADSKHKADNLAQILRMHEHKHQCESLHAQGRIYDAAASLLEITKTVSEDARANKLLMDWTAEFTNRCISTLESIGDKAAANAESHDEALAAYTTALSLSSSPSNALLTKWVSMVLNRGSVTEALGAAAKFQFPKFHIFRGICDVLEVNGQITEAIRCFRHMQSELAEDTSMHAERAAWEVDFRVRCVKKLEMLGDAAMDSQNHENAVKYFSDALKLDPTKLDDILFKRSKARAAMGLWEDALIDADKVVELEPISYRGYERKHAALHGMRRHSEAFGAFDMMLSKLEQSPDPQVRAFRHQYIDATPTIRKVVGQIIRHMPRVLIDTTTGRLHDKTRQAAAFEELPIYDELRSSMTTQLDYARIRAEVKKFYHYVMFSHRWEYGEPLFQLVENISIYELEASPANIKLKMFCKLIRSLGFQWVWSDTCCIDKKDNVVLQESLVAMFTWYRGSSLTIVYLRGIRSESQRPGDLRTSIWNTRAWTYQEYVAAETVQFYTEDWKPYLGLEMFNHKESAAIISEMQQAAGVFTKTLSVLRPGLDRVREKLYLASTRQTTLVEDIAYSLLGIFNVAIPVIYGEGNRAVGRFLEHILTGSGDVTILAWTGHAGSYNSCLPPDLTVYNQLIPPHVPQPIETGEMNSIVTTLQSSLLDLSLPVILHDHLNKLPPPSVAASRLRLPGIVFPIIELDTWGSDPETDLRVYRVTTSPLGEVEIKTADDLSRMNGLLLIHPWISPLLDQEFSHGSAALDNTTRALRLVARLRQPFGALLLEPLSRVQYRRVAADCLIMVQVHEEVSLTELMGGIRSVDIQ